MRFCRSACTVLRFFYTLVMALHLGNRAPTAQSCNVHSGICIRCHSAATCFGPARNGWLRQEAAPAYQGGRGRRPSSDVSKWSGALLACSPAGLKARQAVAQSCWWLCQDLFWYDLTDLVHRNDMFLLRAQPRMPSGEENLKSSEQLLPTVLNAWIIRMLVKGTARWCDGYRASQTGPPVRNAAMAGR